MKRFGFLGEYFPESTSRAAVVIEWTAFAFILGLVVLIVGIQIGIHHGRDLERKAQAAERGIR